jgi:hypothetical protein
MKTKIMLLIISLCIGVYGIGCDGGSSGGFADEFYEPDIDPAKFTADIDNSYLPLTPGTTFYYEGETEDGTETITVEVTSETREVMGVTCLVVRYTVRLGGMDGSRTGCPGA